MTTTLRASPSASRIGNDREAFSAVSRPASSSSAGCLTLVPGRLHLLRLNSPAVDV